MANTPNPNPETEPSLLVSALPLLLLVIALSYNVFVFGDDAVSGSNQLILFGAAAVAALLAIRQGTSWDSLQNGILDAIRLATPAILILLLVGALSGTWLISGIIPLLDFSGHHWHCAYRHWPGVGTK